MSWQERLREAAYTPPSGERLTFIYEDVRRAVTKKTSAFNFPDAEGTLVQDLGATGRRFPLRVFFSGADHDLEAAAFDSGLLEAGAGLLEHPAYGNVAVVPFGEINQRDDLKTAANQTVIEVTFWETIPDVYPLPQVDRAAAVAEKIQEFNKESADELDKEVDVDTAAKKASLKSRYQAFMKKANTTLRKVAKTQKETRAKFDAVYDSINSSLDTLVGDPLTLAFQTSQLIQSPALVLDNVRARLDAYRDLATSIFNGDGAAVTDNNDFRSDDNLALNYVAGTVESVVNAQFETKSDALTAAEEALQLLSDATAWRDGQLTDLGEVDSGAAYQKIQEAVALAAGYLVEISFTLKQERAITLARPRTIIDLAAELYGEVDERLDFLISSNGLTGSEIIELPRGKRIVYYV